MTGIWCFQSRDSTKQPSSIVLAPDFTTLTELSSWFRRPSDSVCGSLRAADARRGVFVLALVYLRRRPALVAALAIGSAVMLALMYVEYAGGYRHHGHLFVLLMLLLWLGASASPVGRPTPGWLTFVLAVQVVAGVYFVALDFKRPFSESKDLALRRPARQIIVVAQPHYLSVGPPPTGYLGRPIYYAISGDIVKGSYLLYDEVRVRGASEDEIIGEIARFASERGTDVFVVVSHWKSNRLGARLIGFPYDTIEHDEGNTAVYVFKRPT